MRETAPVWLAHGTKADAILAKSPGFFPCPLLASIYFPYLNLILVYGPRLLQILEFFSFIGTKIICKACKMIRKAAETFEKCLEGLNFLHLWGEGMALKLKSVTTGRGFNKYPYLVKLQ